MNFIFLKEKLPIWFNIWWVINLAITVVFLYYFLLIEFQNGTYNSLYIIYMLGWGFWAVKFRQNFKKKMLQDCDNIKK